MKIFPKNTEDFIKSPPSEIRLILVYGSDEGLVRETSARIGKTIVSDLSNPFLVSEISGDNISQDSAQLIDEALAISMIGGRRLIRVRDATDNIVKPLEILLETDKVEAITILQSGALNPRSKLRKLIEKSPLSAAIACYPDDYLSLQSLITSLSLIHI